MSRFFYSSLLPTTVYYSKTTFLMMASEGMQSRGRGKVVSLLFFFWHSLNCSLFPLAFVAHSRLVGFCLMMTAPFLVGRQVHSATFVLLVPQVLHNKGFFFSFPMICCQSPPPP